MKSQAMMINARIIINDIISLLIGMEALGVDYLTITQDISGALTFTPEPEEAMLNVSVLINSLTEIYEEGYEKAQMIEEYFQGNPTLVFHPIVEEAEYHPNMKEINMN